MPTPPRAGLSDDDVRQSSLLSTLHYVYAAFTAMAAVAVAGIGLLPGALMALTPRDVKGPPPVVGGLFFAIFGFFAVVLLVKAVLSALAARGLSQRTHYTLVLVSACLELPNVPLGTALGIFTLMHLQKPGVKASFR